MTMSDKGADRTDSARPGLSRRLFLGRAAVASAGVAIGTAAVEAPPASAAETPATATPADPTVDVTCTINGTQQKLSVDPRVTLLDALRERIGLTGTKKGCDRGQCGACTVHIGGRRVLSCLTLAASVQGKDITTVEGLANGGTLHPVQRAFVDCDGFQCGFCTSGQVMSAVALIREGHTQTEADIREWMSGNICRCGAYDNIVTAIQQAAASGGAI